MRRATNELEREERRAALLAAASQLYADRPFEAITMAAVAQRAGVAKGTVYLYFDTKEALFLALCHDQIAAWLTAVDARLSAARGVSQVVAAFNDTLTADPALRRLLAILHSVLERNSDTPSLLAFRQMLRARMTQTAALLVAALPPLTPDEALALLMHAYALAIGLQSVAGPAAPASDLPLFDVAFQTEFGRALTYLLRGALGAG